MVGERIDNEPEQRGLLNEEIEAISSLYQKEDKDKIEPEKEFREMSTSDNSRVTKHHT